MAGCPDWLYDKLTEAGSHFIIKRKGFQMKSILLQYLAKYTTLNEAEQQAIIADIPVQKFIKGTTLLRQGDVPA